MQFIFQASIQTLPLCSPPIPYAAFKHTLQRSQNPLRISTPSPSHRKTCTTPKKTQNRKPTPPSQTPIPTHQLGPPPPNHPPTRPQPQPANPTKPPQPTPPSNQKSPALHLPIQKPRKTTIHPTKKSEPSSTALSPNKTLYSEIILQITNREKN